MDTAKALEQRVMAIASQVEAEVSIREKRYNFSGSGISGVRDDGHFLDVGHPDCTLWLTFEADPDINPTDSQVEEDENIRQLEGYSVEEALSFQHTEFVSRECRDRTTTPSAVEYLSDRGLFDAFDRAVGACQDGILEGSSGQDRKIFEDFVELESVTVAIFHDRTVVVANMSSVGRIN